MDAVKHLGVDDATLAEAVEVMTEVTKGNLIMHSIGGRPWDNTSEPPMVSRTRSDGELIFSNDSTFNNSASKADLKGLRRS